MSLYLVVTPHGSVTHEDYVEAPTMSAAVALVEAKRGGLEPRVARLVHLYDVMRQEVPA